MEEIENHRAGVYHPGVYETQLRCLRRATLSFFQRSTHAVGSSLQTDQVGCDVNALCIRKEHVPQLHLNHKVSCFISSRASPSLEYVPREC